MRLVVSQFAPTTDIGANVTTIETLAQRAAAEGARVVVLPEAAMYPGLAGPEELARCAQPLDGLFVQALVSLAARLDIVLVAGMHEALEGRRPYNTVVAVNGDGVLAAHRKYLVYDAFGTRESDGVSVGVPQADVFDVDGLRLGLITCYEVRFPETARALIDAGAEVLVVCSAWPLAPGKEDHFVTMVRARALENTVYVAAAGDCSPGMVGRSHVVDPLGYVVAGLGEEQGHVGAELDPARIARARETLPVLAQRRRHLLDREATARP